IEPRDHLLKESLVAVMMEVSIHQPLLACLAEQTSTAPSKKHKDQQPMSSSHCCSACAITPSRGPALSAKRSTGVPKASSIETYRFAAGVSSAYDRCCPVAIRPPPRPAKTSGSL